MTCRFAGCVVVLLCAVSLACRGSRNDRSGTGDGNTRRERPPTATQPTTFTGKLTGSAVAIGGETTGWRLAGDGQTGGIDVDVSKVLRRARALDGKLQETLWSLLPLFALGLILIVFVGRTVAASVERPVKHGVFVSPPAFQESAISRGSPPERRTSRTSVCSSR